MHHGRGASHNHHWLGDYLRTTPRHYLYQIQPHCCPPKGCTRAYRLSHRRPCRKLMKPPRALRTRTCASRFLSCMLCLSTVHRNHTFCPCTRGPRKHFCNCQIQARGIRCRAGACTSRRRRSGAVCLCVVTARRRHRPCVHLGRQVGSSSRQDTFDFAALYCIGICAFSTFAVSVFSPIFSSSLTPLQHRSARELNSSYGANVLAFRPDPPPWPLLWRARGTPSKQTNSACL